MDAEQRGMGRQGAYIAGVVGAVLSVAVAVFHFWYGKPREAWIGLAVAVIWYGYAREYRNHGVTWVHHACSWTGTAFLSIVCTMQPQAAVWAFPLLMLNVLLLPVKAASWGNLVLLSLITAVLFGHVDPQTSVRFFSSMLGVAVVAYVFASRVERQRQQLHTLSTTDALSGAGNRRAFDADLTDRLKKHLRYGTPTSLILFDIDHFKQVNDQLGHGIGDRCIAELSRAMGLRLRNTDRLYRYGGEEFVVLAPHTDLASARVLAEALRAEATQLQVDGAPELRVTISLGVAELQRGESGEHWVKLADEALYRAKHRGRNKVQADDASAAPVQATVNAPT